MSKHTPGPWYTQPWPHQGYMGVSSLGWYSNYVIDTMIRIYPRYSHQDGVTPPAVDEAEANARLIAAAPELLEALQDLVLHLDNVRSLLLVKYATASGKSDAYLHAQAVIAKATGEEQT